MKLLSVIVPVFNSEKYIKTCVDSILNSTYRDLELILVDDGSTDGITPSILDEYALKDDRVKVFHKANEGVCRTRNFGIAQASGEYIAFVDNDDWIEPKMYETLINAIEINNIDVAACTFNNEKQDAIYYSFNFSDEQIASTSVEILRSKASMFLSMSRGSNSIEGQIWNKVYKRKCIENHKFRDDVEVNEDSVFSFEIFKTSVDSCAFINLPFLHYRIVKSSITRSGDAKKFFRAIFGAEYLISVAEEINPECLPYLYQNYTNYIFNCLNRVVMMKNNKNEIRILKEKLSKCKVYKKYLNLKTNIAWLVFSIHPAFYKIFVLILK
ncbi:MAG: glycosyltransferase [Candidatus Onthovivens sp.]|nr:glycosyltransferase [Candidatus Onthovivens sp.]